MKAAVFALILAMAAYAQDLFQVSGVIVDDRNNSPVTRATVELLDSAGKTRGSVVTTADGKFRFSVPAGRYVLRGGARNRPMITYGVGPDSGFGSAIMVGPGKSSSDLTLRWYPPAVITGKLTDEAGEPVEGALVQLVLSGAVAGSRQSRTLLWGRSDDLGEYRFFNLRPGHYYLAVTGQPWYAKTGSVDIRSSGFLPTYYPNVRDPQKASAINLRPGTEERADFSITSIAGASLEIHVEGGLGVIGVVSLIAEGLGGTEGFERQENYYGQPAITLAGVTPGRYTARVSGKRGDSFFETLQTVDVAGSQTIQMKLMPLATVSGILTRPDGVPAPKGSVVIVLTREQTHTNRTTAADPDGKLRFPALTSGTYQVTARVAEGYYLRDIEVAGAPWKNGQLELNAGDTPTLKLTLSDGAGKVAGTAARDGKPAPAALVVLYPVDGPTPTLRAHGFQTESDGSFDLVTVHPGSYYLFALENTGLEYQNPEAVKPYLPGARLVQIEPRTSYREQVPLSAPSSRPR